MPTTQAPVSQTQSRNSPPVFGNPGGSPDVSRLIASFRTCSPWDAAGYNRVASNEAIRYNRGMGHTPDCRKHGTPNSAATPWEGASNQKDFTADHITNGIVAECLEAFTRAWHSPRAGTNEVSNYAVKLADYIVNTWCAEELPVAAERAAQYLATYGWVPLHPRWELELSLRYQVLEFDQLLEAAQALSERLHGPEGAGLLAQMPMAEQLADLPAAILDPARTAEAAELLQLVYLHFSAAALEEYGPGVAQLTLPELQPATLRKAIRDLRMEGSARVPVPYVCKNQPTLAALKPWEEFFVTNDCAQLEKSLSFRVDWLSEVDLRAKEKSEDWDPGWIAEAVKHKGKFSAWQYAVAASPTAISPQSPQSLTALMGGGEGWAGDGSGLSTFQMPQHRQDLIQVVYAIYRMLDENGVPGVYMTIFHPNVGASDAGADGKEGQAVSKASSYAWHGLIDAAEGMVPFLVGKREELAPTITSSRGIPEICNSWQRVKKVHLDAPIDHASLAVTPPVNTYANALGTSYRWGPKVENTVQPGREPKFMEIPNSGVPIAFEISDRVDRGSKEYFGEAHPELVPGSGQARRNKMVGSFLLLMTRGVQRMVNLCQANMSDADFAEVTGAPAGWLDDRREHPGLLATSLEFDIRELDPAYVSEVLKAMNETVIPADVGGVINRTKWTRKQMQMLNPRLARELVQDDGDASKQMFDRVKSDVAMMFVGQEADYVEMDPAAKAKLSYLQQVIQANPLYQRGLAAGGRFGDLLQKYIENLQFSLTQEQNKQVGRIGVQTDAMEQGQ